MYFVVAELAGKSKEVQTVRLLNAAGADAQEIHELFTFTSDDEKKEYKTYALGSWLNTFDLKGMWCSSIIVSSVAIRRRWLKDLRLIAKNCEFAEEFSVCN